MIAAVQDSGASPSPWGKLGESRPVARVRRGGGTGAVAARANVVAGRVRGGSPGGPGEASGGERYPRRRRRPSFPGVRGPRGGTPGRGLRSRSLRGGGAANSRNPGLPAGDPRRLAPGDSGRGRGAQDPRALRSRGVAHPLLLRLLSGHPQLPLPDERVQGQPGPAQAGGRGAVPGGPRKAFRSGGQGDLAAGTGGAGGASSQLRRLRHREGGIDAPDPAGARRAGCPGPRLRPSSGGAPLSRLRRLLRPPRGQPARRRHRRPPHEQAEGRWAARGLPLPPGGPPRRARIGAAARGRAVAHRGAAGLFAAPAHPPRGRSGVGAGPAGESASGRWSADLGGGAGGGPAQGRRTANRRRLRGRRWRRRPRRRDPDLRHPPRGHQRRDHPDGARSRRSLSPERAGGGGEGGGSPPHGAGGSLSLRRALRQGDRAPSRASFGPQGGLPRRRGREDRLPGARRRSLHRSGTHLLRPSRITRPRSCSWTPTPTGRSRWRWCA